jgi:hypothetical protein
MGIKVVFKVTRAANGVPAGTEVQCPIQKCVKEGTMTVTTVGDNSATLTLPRSRLTFSRFINEPKAVAEVPAVTPVQPEGVIGVSAEVAQEAAA